MHSGTKENMGSYLTRINITQDLIDGDAQEKMGFNLTTLNMSCHELNT